MPPSSKSNRENAQQRPASIPSAPSNHPPGERERVATLSHPVTRGGCRGAERPTSAQSETASTKGQPASSGTKISARTTPGERERVRTLSHPVTRGGVGERSAPRSRRRKRNPHPNSPSRRQEPASPPKPLPASSEMKPHPNSPLRRRKPASPPKHFPASSEIQIPAEPSPGERERVATLSHPVARGGVGERSAPRLRRRKQRPQENSPHRREPKSAPEQPTGELERVATLSHPVTRGGVGERSAPRPRRRKQRPQKDNLLRREPISPPEQPRESARGCEPSRLPIEAGDLRGGKVACPKGKQVASRPTKRNRRFRLVAPGR